MDFDALVNYCVGAPAMYRVVFDNLKAAGLVLLAIQMVICFCVVFPSLALSFCFLRHWTHARGWRSDHPRVCSGISLCDSTLKSMDA